MITYEGILLNWTKMSQNYRIFYVSPSAKGLLGCPAAIMRTFGFPNDFSTFEDSFH